MIVVDVSKCTGCRRCETTCSFYHTGRVNRHLARIKVTHLYEMGIDGPILCQQCQERYCMTCPVDALTIGKYGQVIVSPTVCTLCGVCEKACPIGAIEQFNGFIYVCDLCGGQPKCVDACTEGALTFRVDKIEHCSLSTFKIETKQMNPSQKRSFYLKQLGLEVRKTWRRDIA